MAIFINSKLLNGVKMKRFILLILLSTISLSLNCIKITVRTSDNKIFELDDYDLNNLEAELFKDIQPEQAESFIYDLLEVKGKIFGLLIFFADLPREEQLRILNDFSQDTLDKLIFTTLAIRSEKLLDLFLDRYTEIIVGEEFLSKGTAQDLEKTIPTYVQLANVKNKSFNKLLQLEPDTNLNRYSGSTMERILAALKDHYTKS